MAKYADFIDKIALVIASGAIAGAAGVVIMQIIGRYFFHFAFVWGEELPRYLMICATFIGASCAVKRAKMANISIVTAKLPPQIRNIVAIAACLCGIFFLILVTYFGMQQIFSPAILMQRTPAMRLPMWIPYLCVPLGCFFMLVHLVDDLIANLGSLRRAGQ